MAFPKYSLRSYAGGATPTTLATSIAANDLTFTLNSTTNWYETDLVNSTGHPSANPLGNSGPFVVALDYGTATEEKILCSSVVLSTGVVTVWVDGSNSSNTGRGYDGSAAQPHTSGSSGTALPVFTSTEAGVANYAVQQTVGQIVSAGDILQGSGANTLGVLTAGTAGTVLTSNGSGSALSWSTFAQPSGTLLDFAGGTVPAGFLACDGAAVSRSTYAGLFAVIGTTWGVGNGTTTFNVPDLRGRATIGAGTGTGLTARTLAGTTGTETVTLTSAQSGMPSHNHGGSTGNTNPNHTHSQTGFSGGIGSGSGFGLGTLSVAPGSTFSDTNGTNVNHLHSISSDSANASQSHNIMQPSAVVTKIIKY